MNGGPERPGGNPERLPLEEVERLVALVRESGVGEVRVRRGEVEVTVKAMPEAPPVASAPASGAVPVPVLPPEEASQEGPAEPLAERNGLHEVRSPLVGTFYRGGAPGEKPYVEVGDRVEAGQTLCIVEAMKLMNEIPSDVSGEVVAVLAENTGGVEYDQPLFSLRPEG